MFGYAVWLEVDKPAAYILIQQAEKQCGENCEGYGDVVVQFSTAMYITITAASLAILISMFGCFGALYTNRYDSFDIDYVEVKIKARYQFNVILSFIDILIITAI